MSLRKATFLVTRRELTERLRSRSFQVSLLVTAVVVAVIGIVAGVVSDDGRKEYTVGVVGSEARAVAEAARAVGPTLDAEITLEREPSAAAARSGVRDERLDAAVVDGAIVTLREPADQLAQALQVGARQVRAAEQLRSEGITGPRARRVLDPPPLRSVALEGEDDGARGVAFVAALVLYMLLVLYGIAVSMGVVEEKASRVIEVLLATVEPRAILAGKILGIGALGLVQLAVTAVIGLAAASASGAIELDSGDLGTLAVVLVWFLLGYLLWSALFATAGVMVSRQEDLNSSTTVLTVLLVVGYLLAFPSLDDPDGTLAVVMSLFPFYSPIIMPLRVAMGVAGPVEIALSLALLVVAIGLLVPLGARIYERSVLRMGRPMRLAEALRAARA